MLQSLCSLVLRWLDGTCNTKDHVPSPSSCFFQVGNLQTENAALHSRTSILEKVLDMRNEQIQVMQESKEVCTVSSVYSQLTVVPCHSRLGRG